MRIVFFGTASFAARILQFLIQNKVNIAAVVTRADKPQGRNLKLQAPPVKQLIQQISLQTPVLQPAKASTEEFAEQLHRLHADLFVVVAYGEILKNNILSIPRFGCINVHASLLPKYRGAAPIQRCLMQGETETGVSIMRMVLAMDAGDVYGRIHMPITESTTYGELQTALSDLAGPKLLEVLHNLEAGTAHQEPQDHAAATFAPKISTADQILDWRRSARDLHNQVRALSPSPGAISWLQMGNHKKRIKILRTQVVDIQGEPGQSYKLASKEWVVNCGQQALKILEVQLEGKQAMNTEIFLRGAPNQLVFADGFQA